MNVYICGNPLVDNDSMPFRILEGLKSLFPEINFAEYDPTENFPEDNPVYIIDTVLGIKDVVKIDDIDSFVPSPNLSVHDADLAFQLNLMKKLGKLPEIVIFGVPEKGDEREILDQLSKHLKKGL
jgi:Ni,Fe-hydrogenase maturation factor